MTLTEKVREPQVLRVKTNSSKPSQLAVLGVAILLVLVAGIVTAVHATRDGTDDLLRRTVSNARALVRGDAAFVHAQFSPGTKGLLTREELARPWATLSTAVGGFVDISGAEQFQAIGSRVAVVRLAFEREDVLFTTTFDDADRIVGLRLFGIAGVDPPVLNEILELADDVISGLARGDTASVRDRFDPTMTTRATPALLAESWDRFVRVHGAFEGATDMVAVDLVGGRHVVTRFLRFARYDGTVRISIDSQRRVSGLFLLEPTAA